MSDMLMLVSILITAVMILIGGGAFLLLLILLAGLQATKLRSWLHRVLCRISFDCFGRGGMAGRGG